MRCIKLKSDWNLFHLTYWIHNIMYIGIIHKYMHPSLEYNIIWCQFAMARSDSPNTFCYAEQFGSAQDTIYVLLENPKNLLSVQPKSFVALYLFIYIYLMFSCCSSASTNSTHSPRVSGCHVSEASSPTLWDPCSSPKNLCFLGAGVAGVVVVHRRSAPSSARRIWNGVSASQSTIVWRWWQERRTASS